MSEATQAGFIGRLFPALAEAWLRRYLSGQIASVLGVKLILAHALAIGVSSAVETPARQVLLLTSLQDATHTSNAVAMNTMVYNVGRMVGPTIAGFVYPTLGPASIRSMCTTTEAASVVSVG